MQWMAARIPTVVGPRRKRRRRSTWRLWLVAFAAVAALLGVTAYRAIVGPWSRPDDRNRVHIHRSHRTAEPAFIYPYSIIPGGAYSRSELVSAMARDPVVSAHYQGLRADSVATSPVASERWAYVSYRIGDAVYWTRKPVRIRAGEILLSDGRESVRARCGNRISDTAKLPVARNDPPLMLLDDPPPVIGDPLAYIPSDVPDILRSVVAPPVVTPPDGATMDTPEPGSLVMMMLGICGGAALYRRKRTQLNAPAPPQRPPP
jgi:hypothetical protein